MIKQTRNSLTCFQFEVFNRYPDLVHGIFTRLGGASPPPFDSLNCRYHRPFGTGEGDAPENVSQNRKALAEWLGINKTAFIRQVHGTSVLQIKNSTDLNAARTVPADAMVTDLPDVLLCTKLADCQAVLLFDPFRRVIANIHSGWRGSIADIIGHTVTLMKTVFCCDPARMVAGISPSLGPCCAEFINYQKEIPKAFWKYKDDRDHFDFWRISLDQLQAAGVPGTGIEAAPICTCCHTDLFFSYRKEGITGRFPATMALKST